MRVFILLLLTMFITACASKKPEVVVHTKYEYVTYEIPKNLLTNCRPKSPPIDADKYNKLSQLEKEAYLTSYSIMLMGELKKCDNKVRGIERYIKEVNKTAQGNEAVIK